MIKDLKQSYSRKMIAFKILNEGEYHGSWNRYRNDDNQRGDDR